LTAAKTKGRSVFFFFFFVIWLKNGTIYCGLASWRCCLASVSLRLFISVITSIFKINHKFVFNTLFIVHGLHCYLHSKRKVTQSSSSLLLASCVEKSFSTVHLSDSIVYANSGACLYCSNRTRFDPKLNALNRVRHSKIKKIFYFLFLIVFYSKKLVFKLFNDTR